MSVHQEGCDGPLGLSPEAAMDHDPATAPEPGQLPAPDAVTPLGSPSGSATPGPQGIQSRRRFLAWLGGFTVFSTLAMITTPILGFLVPPRTSGTSGGGKVLVATTADIPPGAGKVVALGSKPAIVVSTEQGLHAFSAICTHLGCVVAWNDLAGVIQCPCHDGRFNPVSGTVVSGPPPAPLPALKVSVEGDQIFLSEA
jgi:cytochrome b6-f complex iron-sulfur subunit